MSDEIVAALFSAEMVFNQAGTQLPMSQRPERGDRSGVESYLERRRLLCRAFPDIHFRLLEQTCKGDGHGFVIDERGVLEQVIAKPKVKAHAEEILHSEG